MRVCQSVSVSRVSHFFKFELSCQTKVSYNLKWQGGGKKERGIFFSSEM